MSFATINPVDNQVVEKYREHSDKTVEVSIKTAQEAFLTWKKSAQPLRTKYLRSVAEVLRSDQEELAQLMTLEMGKPIKESRAEVEKCAWVCDYYADNARHFLKDEVVNTDASNSYISYEPLGIIFGIMPWNFPFWQVFRFAAPSLMAGNVILLKHAASVPQCAMAIEEVFRKANMDEGIFQSLLISNDRTQQVIEHPDVKAVTLTGSDRAGSAVAAMAGKHIKKTVLELGGSDPCVILEDANLKEAAKHAVKSRMQNAGQSCIAAKRFIVVASVYDQFLKLITQEVAAIKVGDPMDESVGMGPLAREDLAKTVYKQIQRSVKKGATIAIGGDRPDREGAFVNPTILTGIKPGMPAFEEEIFGPVASVVVAKDTDEAITLANDTEFGLGASIWTEDIDRAARLARQINAGAVFINGIVKSDPRLPFGGINRSGFGRELSHHGIHEFVNIKTVWIG